uniref:Uncharacterized protein n=1 Tax=viral metagenome TaxID=1070528 RepID=A0A6C0EHM9_9ZZZZ
MLQTLQIILYSFIIIFIGHNLYLFYVDNFIEKTHHNIIPTMVQGNPKKIQIYNDLKNIDSKMDQFNNQDSQNMKNELQNFLKSQISPSNIDELSNNNVVEDVTQHVGSTNIDDIPITA